MDLDDDVEVGLLTSTTLNTTGNVKLGCFKSMLGSKVKNRSRSSHLVPLANNVELGSSKSAVCCDISNLCVRLHAITTNLGVHSVQLGSLLGAAIGHGVSGLEVGLHAITTNLGVHSGQMRSLLGTAGLHGIGSLEVGLHAITTNLGVDGGQMRSLLGATVLHGVDGLKVGLHAITTNLGVHSGQMRSLLGATGLHGISSLEVLGSGVVLLAVNLALRLVGLGGVHAERAVAFTALEALLVEEKVLNLNTLNGISSLTASVALVRHY